MTEQRPRKRPQGSNPFSWTYHKVYVHTTHSVFAVPF
ncbi:hypothetical protein BRADI_4g10295v3 [Brachypodium distachyon]|uniref:Uncharacterized protein n=1 Tax=Brachypodium distachyon TaxID=15368 RepID=A0A2K2CLT3_BRADI|nr:hypothetical protein BRADI_4g10295v3 [Brachypodium distachyon]